MKKINFNMEKYFMINNFFLALLVSALLTAEVFADPVGAGLGLRTTAEGQQIYSSLTESGGDIIKLAWNWNAAQQMHHTTLAIELTEWGYEVGINYRGYNDQRIQSWVSVDRIFNGLFIKPFIGLNLFNTATWAIDGGMYIPLLTTGG